MFNALFRPCISKNQSQAPDHTRSLNHIHGQLKDQLNPVTKKGVCFGLSSNFAKAYLTDHADHFLQRLHRAADCRDGDLLQDIKTFQDNVHFGHHFYTIFKETEPDQARDVSNPLNLNGIFTRDTLKYFISALPGFPQGSRAVFMAHSTTHAIALAPQHDRTWTLFDPSNTRSSTPEQFCDAESLAERLFSTLYGQHDAQGNQLAIHLSLLHLNRPEFNATIKPEDISRCRPILQNITPHTRAELCTLAIQSNDNTTLRRILGGKKLTESNLENLTKGVQRSGFYRDRHVSKSEILTYCAQHRLVAFESIATALRCSVVEVFRYADDIRALWLSRL